MSNPKILVTEPTFPRSATELLQTRCEVYVQPSLSSRKKLLEDINGKDGIIVFPLTKVDSELLDAAGPQLKFISTYSVGYDHIDLQVCKKRNIVVGHTPNVLNSCVAELGIALLLTTARRIVETTNAIKQGKWSVNFNPHWLFGVEIADSVVGIVGFGRIGQAIAKRLCGFEPKEILYTDIHDVPAASQLKAKRVSFEELLHNSDFVIVCVPSIPSTNQLFDESAFSKMKSNAIFINISRGSTVKQSALVSALASKQILAAGLDVMEIEPVPLNDPILKLENCVMTPHLGTATYACREKMALLAAQNILDALDGKQMSGQVYL